MQALRLNKVGITLIVVLLLSIGSAVFFYVKLKNVSQQQAEQAKSAVAGNVVEEVSKLIILPKNEEPTVATVLDLEKVKDQPFLPRLRWGMLF